MMDLPKLAQETAGSLPVLVTAKEREYAAQRILSALNTAVAQLQEPMACGHKKADLGKLPGWKTVETDSDTCLACEREAGLYLRACEREKLAVAGALEAAAQIVEDSYEGSKLPNYVKSMNAPRNVAEAIRALTDADGAKALAQREAQARLEEAETIFIDWSADAGRGFFKTWLQARIAQRKREAERAK